MSEPERLLQMDDVHVRYPTGKRRLFGARHEIQAVAGASLELAAGETLGLVGESGSGKSTLVRAAMGMEKPAAGRITVAGRDVSRPTGSTRRWLARHVQLVLQDPYTALNPRMTVEDVVAEGMDIHGLTDNRAHRRARVQELLEQVGLDASAASRFPHEFSGGQRQRIGIARALALDPKVLLCDEPVSALDVSVQAQILNLLQDLKDQRGLSLLIVTHDLTVVDHIADRIAVMYLGRIVESGPAGTSLEDSHPYTRALRSAAPRMSGGKRPAPALLSGDLPDPAHPPTGCRFHTRCPVVQPQCSEVDPPVVAVGPAHEVACVLAEPYGAVPVTMRPTSHPTERNAQ